MILCVGRKSIGFNVWIENDFAFSVGIEIDLVTVWDEHALFLVLGFRFCVGGRDWLAFYMRAKNHLILVLARKLTWFHVWVVEID